MLSVWIITSFSMLMYTRSIDPYRFHRRIPKIELHAHLHGSIRPSTMVDLAMKHPIAALLTDVEAAIAGKRDLKKCFAIFNILHELVSSKSVLERIMKETLEDMMEDNIIYCELRSTPRALPDGTSMIGYITTLIELTNQHNMLHGRRMLVKLLVSIDRSKSLSIADEILDSVLYLRQQHPINHIVGLDFSGNPSKNRFDDFEPVLARAREHGLQITIHTGELPADMNNDSQELDKILSFKPDRLGHALFLERNHIDDLINRKKLALLSNNSTYKAPAIEICPTSNYFTMNLDSYLGHPIFQTFNEGGYPISINTDDSGVFQTSLSEEYYHMQTAFLLTDEQMIKLAESVVDQIFADDLKGVVRMMFYQRLRDTLHHDLSQSPSLRSHILPSSDIEFSAIV